MLTIVRKSELSPKPDNQQHLRNLLPQTDPGHGQTAIAVMAVKRKKRQSIYALAFDFTLRPGGILCC